MMRLIAEHADIWNISGPPHNDFDFLADRVRRLDAECARIGRDPARSAAHSSRSSRTTTRPPRGPSYSRAVALGFDHIVLSLPPAVPGARRSLAAGDEIIHPSI